MRALSLPSERTVVVCVSVCESTQFTVREDCCGVCECVRALSLPSERTVVVCVCV